MADKIETSLIRWDIRDLVSNTEVYNNEIKEKDAIRTMDAIMEKVTEFINDNYIPKS